MNDVYLGIGGNLGNVPETIQAARELMEVRVGKVIDSSKQYTTKAWGVEDQPDFVNQVLRVETNLEPKELLINCLEIERELGRVRETRWGERVIDVDILYFNDEVQEEEHLQIPHPRLHERNFVLIPLADIAFDKVHPIFHKDTKELLSECKDNLEVNVL